VQQILIETYSSGAWSAGEGALPANANLIPQANLDAVSCPASGSCVAAGSFVDADGNRQALVDTLVDGSWIPGEPPLPPMAAADPDAQLNAISCPTTTSCVAVGSYESSSTTVEQPPLIETLAGSTWTPLAAPIPSNAGSGNLNGVSCPGDGSCVPWGRLTDSLTPAA
jgi:hypothetical protein